MSWSIFPDYIAAAVLPCYNFFGYPRGDPADRCRRYFKLINILNLFLDITYAHAFGIK